MNSRAKILLLIFLFFQTADAKADWPNWGGPNRDFRVNDAGVFPPDQNYALKIVWKKAPRRWLLIHLDSRRPRCNHVLR